MKSFKQLREELDLSWASRLDEETLNELGIGKGLAYTAKAYGSAVKNIGKAAVVGVKQRSVKAAYASEPARKVINRTVGIHRAVGVVPGKDVRNSMNAVRSKMSEAFYDVDEPTPLRDARHNYQQMKSMTPQQRHLHVRNVRAMNALKGTAVGAVAGSAIGGPIGGTIGAVAGGISNYAYKRPSNY